MGDRAVYGFRGVKADPTLFLYDHWGGAAQSSTIRQILLATMPRWDDHNYASRIAVSQVIGNDWDNETGYGLYIRTSRGGSHGSDYPFVTTFEWSARTIFLCDRGNDSRVLKSFLFLDVLTSFTEVDDYISLMV